MLKTVLNMTEYFFTSLNFSYLFLRIVTERMEIALVKNDIIAKEGIKTRTYI